MKICPAYQCFTWPCVQQQPPLHAVFGRPFAKPRDGFSMFQRLLLSSPVISSLHRLRLGARRWPEEPGLRLSAGPKYGMLHQTSGAFFVALSHSLPQWAFRQAGFLNRLSQYKMKYDDLCYPPPHLFKVMRFCISALLTDGLEINRPR